MAGYHLHHFQLQIHSWNVSLQKHFNKYLTKKWETIKKFILTCESRNVSAFSPCCIARKPDFSSGRKTPVTWTWSPGTTRRVFSPFAITVIVRGILPTGTWSLCSWIFSSWYFINFEPLVCKCNCPPDLKE